MHPKKANANFLPIRASRSRQNNNVFAHVPQELKERAKQKGLRTTGIIGREIHNRTVLAEIRKLDNRSTHLEKLGAILLLTALIESRIDAMYNDLRRILDHLAVNTQSNQMHQPNQPNTHPKNKDGQTTSLKNKIDYLQKHKVITHEMAEEYQEFRIYRNALIHDATYKAELFTSEFIAALVELYQDVVRVRRRVKHRMSLLQNRS
jgi:hypothetical protein